jgi:hypothetical protein
MSLRPAAAFALCLLLLAPAALAEGGHVQLGPDQPESLVDAARLQADAKNAYAITVAGSADGILSCDLKPNVRTMHANLLLMDADGGTLAEAYADQDGKVARLQCVVGPGRYTLEVGDTHGVTRQKPYRLTSRFQAVSDRYEPNDTFEQAKPLHPGEAVQITLFRFHESDQDTFVYRHKGGSLHVQTGFASNISPALKVYSPQHEEVGAAYATNPGAALTYDEEQPAGTYYLVVTDGTGNTLPHPLTLTARSR